MALSSQEIALAFETELPLALAHAGLAQDRVRPFLTDGTTPSHADIIPAWLWPPHHQIDENSALTGDERQAAEKVADAYRLEFHLDLEQPPELDEAGLEALVGGLIRHELEHVKQHEACGDAPLQLHHLAIGAIRQEQGEVPFELLRESPIELDANAGSAEYLRKRHPDQLDALAATEKHGNLVRSRSSPRPYETLTRRMVVFLFGFREGLSRHFWQAPIGQTLADHVSQEAADFWAELEAQPQ